MIRGDDALWDALVELCDFDARWPIDESEFWFELADRRPVIALGGDAGGGRFVVISQALPPEHATIYVSSEGQAGSIARDVPAMLSLFVAHPYWRDCLHFSAAGDLSEMRRAAMRFEADLQAESPNANAQRRMLRERLRLSALQDPLQLLHASVSASPAIVNIVERQPCESLFGGFRV